MSEKTEALHEQEAAHIYRLRDEIMRQEIEMYRLRAQRDALLEVAKLALRMGQYGGVSPRTVEDAARAAIKAAEENT